jgi:hypothetical protein
MLMTKDYTFLKYTDIPFSYALVTLLFKVNLENYQILLPYIVIIGSVLASAIELMYVFSSLKRGLI